MGLGLGLGMEGGIFGRGVSLVVDCAQALSRVGVNIYPWARYKSV